VASTAELAINICLIEFDPDFGGKGVILSRKDVRRKDHVLPWNGSPKENS
jgi:hypothetical protein